MSQPLDRQAWQYDVVIALHKAASVCKELRFDLSVSKETDDLTYLAEGFFNRLSHALAKRWDITL